LSTNNLAEIKTITNKDLFNSTGDSIQKITFINGILLVYGFGSCIVAIHPNGNWNKVYANLD
jgi:hypothetical protein